MNGFTLLWSKILDSSIWMEDKETRLVWITMLAMKDAEGNVRAARAALAHRARVTDEECERALGILMAPDLQSMTPDNEGRRIREVPGGWVILNHELYRYSTEAKREFWKAAKAEQRARKVEKEKVSGIKTFSPASRVALHHLNEKTGKKFRETQTNLGFIQARLSEDGVDLAGVRLMIDRQVSRWKGDPKMEQYLRPETLFNKTKFDGYYAAKDMPVNSNGNGETPWIKDAVGK